MNRSKSIVAAFILLSSVNVAVQANDTLSGSRNKLISLYGSNNETASTHENTGSFFYDTEDTKVTLLKGTDISMVSTQLRFNPINKGYLKAGAGYINQKLLGESINTYSGSLGLGYMLQDDLYVEAGGSVSKLNGSNTISDETTKTAYASIEKRFNTSVGTIDTSLLGGKIDPKYTENKNFYNAGLNYYPVDNVRVGYTYSHIKNNITNYYTLDYGYLVAGYSHSLSYYNRTVTLGVQFAFTDLLNVSSYTMPTNIKRHLSE